MRRIGSTLGEMMLVGREKAVASATMTGGLGWTR
jgi:hypothetical protein